MKSTITAITTAPGVGGVAIIRLSGPEALGIAERCFSGNALRYKSHTVHFGDVIDPETKEFIDQALLLVMHAPNSYTGEDVVEIQCHGGQLIPKKVLACTLKAGARMAGPGEFTHRSFMSGKIDLAQAEAVSALIAANSESALRAAKEQLEGKLSKQVTSLKERLTHIAALFEVWVDFPDEELEFASKDEVIAQLSDVKSQLQRYIDSFEEGRLIHDGISLALIGAPNVGKSSLLNALLDHERAIVSPQAGTTRDLVQERMQLFGHSLLLTDTAGIRSTKDAIEEEGIRRSKQQAEKADIVLVLLDASQGITEEDRNILSLIPKERSLIIWNKVDLKQPPQLDQSLSISAKRGDGIDALKSAIKERIFGSSSAKGEVVITEARHKEAISHAFTHTTRALDGLEKGHSPDLLTSDLRSSLSALGCIIGSDIQEDILDKIFSSFCIGK